MWVNGGEWFSVRVSDGRWGLVAIVGGEWWLVLSIFVVTRFRCDPVIRASLGHLSYLFV